ncbi:hypothetical protein D1AOALGA4SA_6232 [Olavius algarvensis Delta 1 endosymbiont]|nr:hypothetical protein D1AOALGA4SA_6232 [Olavius algarvensis Delta 1 endosymbiont]
MRIFTFMRPLYRLSMSFTVPYYLKQLLCRIFKFLLVSSCLFISY